MNRSIIEDLAKAWANVVDLSSFLESYDGTPSVESHQACEKMQAKMREYIIATDDRRLFGLLHLLGQASLSMEKSLWPEEYERLKCEIETAVRETDNTSSKNYSHEEAMRLIRERITKGDDPRSKKN